MKDYIPGTGHDVDGTYASPLDVRLSAATQRRKRVDAGKCMNNAAHGPATHGKKCKRCFAVHRYGVAIVNERGIDALDFSDRRRTQRCHLGAA